MRTLLSSLAFASFLVLASLPASAVTILTFGQQNNNLLITGTATATGTNLSGTDVPVTVTQIDAGVSVPTPAYFDLFATSTPAGAITASGLIIEHFTGTFSVNSAANNTGTNYLSGTFSDGALTRQGSTSIAVFAPDGAFSSDVITDLSNPSLTLGLTGVTPAVSLVAAANGSGQTINSFGATVDGNASATATEVTEPASLGILGGLLVAAGFIAHRRRRNIESGTGLHAA